MLYRIARGQYARDLTGRGGLLTTARWHDHLPVIYTSLNSSTCILEKLVHLNTEEIHHDLVTVTINVPNDAESQRIEIAQLPLNWNTYPAPPMLQRIGNAWLKSKSALLLYLPSVIDPMAQNVLINPMHPQAEKLSIGIVKPFSFDRRLVK